jgi:hypothetical protein
LNCSLVIVAFSENALSRYTMTVVKMEKKSPYQGFLAEKLGRALPRGRAAVHALDGLALGRDERHDDE